MIFSEYASIIAEYAKNVNYNQGVNKKNEQDRDLRYGVKLMPVTVKRLFSLPGAMRIST